VFLSRSSYTANESQGLLTITIERSGTTALNSVETVHYGVKQVRNSARNHVDFDTVPNRLATFEPGQTSFIFHVKILDNGIYGTSLHAQAYIYGASPRPLGSPTNANITILRNDPLQTRVPLNPLAITEAGPGGILAAAPDADPLQGAKFYIPGRASTPGKAAARIARKQPKLAKQLDVIADAPIGYRFWYWNTQHNTAGLVAHYLEDAERKQPGTTVQLTTYSLIHGKRGSTATPAFAAKYANWIKNVATGIGNFHVVMFLELDSLITAGGLTSKERAIRFGEISNAVQTLEQDPHVAVYIDAGAADAVNWQKAAKWLAQSDVKQAQGFFLNSTHFDWTTKEVRYGQQIAQRLGGVHFVVNTGGNGRGPLENKDKVKNGNEQLCNPVGRGLGPWSTSTGFKYVDALMWMAVPGNSGGACRPGAPPTAVFWPAYAESLVHNADYKITGPHEPLIRQGKFIEEQPKG
jgi:endoglucanase